MRFVVDNQLPPRLARFLQERGHDAVHVIDVGLDDTDDQTVWMWAMRESRVVVSKDEDFLFLANRQGDHGRLLRFASETAGRTRSSPPSVRRSTR